MSEPHPQDSCRQASQDGGHPHSADGEPGRGHDGQTCADRLLLETLAAVRSQVRGLTVAVVFLILVVLLLAAAVHGSLINYWDGDASFYAATSCAATVLGAAFGWFARGRR